MKQSLGKILLLGANGQLGRSFKDVCDANYQIVEFAREDLDIGDEGSLRRAFEQTDFDICVNCAAYTAVDNAETDVSATRMINATAVGTIATLCREHDTLLLHFSTDYVYDSASASVPKPLKETDSTDPRSVYALTKFEGEQLAMRNNPKTVVLRTSWVYSEYGHNFVKTMLKLADKGVHPSVVSDQTGCPTYARDLASAAFAVIKYYDIDKSGIYNFCNSGQTNWFEFAQEIFALWGREVDVTPTSTEAFGAAAYRPSYSVLDCSKFRNTFGSDIRSWREALAECHHRMTSMAQNHN